MEGKKVDLSRKKKAGEHVEVEKCLTRRNINIEAVACTFRPIGRTRGNFEVNDSRNNMILFDFELEVDTQKVLTGEPWAFDRHLVVMERYDGSYPVHTLKLDSTLRWVGLLQVRTFTQYL